MAATDENVLRRPGPSTSEYRESKEISSARDALLARIVAPDLSQRISPLSIQVGLDRPLCGQSKRRRYREEEGFQNHLEQPFLITNGWDSTRSGAPYLHSLQQVACCPIQSR
jgi:hypothetical protein